MGFETKIPGEEYQNWKAPDSNKGGSSEDEVADIRGVNEPRYVAGVRKNSDGSIDYSRAMFFEKNKAQETESILSEAEQRKLAQQIMMGSYREKDRQIGWKAKDKGTTKEELLAEMRGYGKSQINHPEKVTHFHKTSFENLHDILELGGLLSRSEVKKRKPDKKLPGWSASDDVMMTRDKYDKDGKLIARGRTSHNVGASGKGIVLVMGPKVMELDNYDCLCSYPTVSDAPLQENCTNILVSNNEDKKKAEDMIRKFGISGPDVTLQEDWEKDHYK